MNLGFEICLFCLSISVARFHWFDKYLIISFFFLVKCSKFNHFIHSHTHSCDSGNGWWWIFLPKNNNNHHRTNGVFLFQPDKKFNFLQEDFVFFPFLPLIPTSIGSVQCFMNNVIRWLFFFRHWHWHLALYEQKKHMCAFELWALNKN